MITRVLALVVLGFAQQSAPSEPSGESKVRVSQADAPAPVAAPANRILAPQVSPQKPAASPLIAEPAISPQAARGPVSQVSKTIEARSPTPQLAPKGPSAAPPPALSKPSQGRDTRAAALKGSDRCSGADAARESEICARVIETRSAEFAAPDHEPLSPEQRLLANQNLLDSAPSDVNAAARRLSTGREDDTLAALAVANQALAKPVVVDSRKEDETKATAPNVVDALVAAIVQQANGGIPPN